MRKGKKGILNTAFALWQKRVRLRVRVMMTLERDERVCVVVTNLSEFPVTIEKVGFVLDAWYLRTLKKVPGPEAYRRQVNAWVCDHHKSGCRWPWARPKHPSRKASSARESDGAGKSASTSSRFFDELQGIRLDRLWGHANGEVSNQGDCIMLYVMRVFTLADRQPSSS